jgi:hypothetical protein
VKLLGFPITDINGYSDIGFMQPQTTTKDGRRFSTAKSYLKRALKAGSDESGSSLASGVQLHVLKHEF